jgi:3-methyladenine DNA glycosylase AlkD
VSDIAAEVICADRRGKRSAADDGGGALLQPQNRARAIAEAVDALPERSTAPMREVRRAASRELKAAAASEVRAVARPLIFEHGLRWIGYELIAAHRKAFASLTEVEADEMAQGLATWDAVDAYGMILAGPAWQKGLIGDELIARWAASPDLWRRRLALVATVPLGRKGDAARVLAVCEPLAADREDMVEKALSWALRELSKGDRAAVEAFLARHDAELGARVKREVRHKLATGLKSPRRGVA